MALLRPKNGGFSSILVAVHGRSSDRYAVELACSLLSSKKGALYILYIIEVERGLPLDAEVAEATATAEDALTAMEEVAGPFRCNVEAEMLQSRRAGPAIVQVSANRQVDAIVLGTDLTTRYGSFSLGATVPYVLENAPCKVILWRGELSSNGAAP